MLKLKSDNLKLALVPDFKYHKISITGSSHGYNYRKLMNRNPELPIWIKNTTSYNWNSS